MSRSTGEPEIDVKLIDESTLTKGQLRKLYALCKSVGQDIGERAFAEWLSSQAKAEKTDRNIDVIAGVLWPLVQDGKLQVRRDGYLVRRGRGGGSLSKRWSPRLLPRLLGTVLGMPRPGRGMQRTSASPHARTCRSGRARRNRSATRGAACSAAGERLSEDRDEGTMPGALLNLDCPPSWLAELRAYLDERHDLFLEWEIKKQAQVPTRLRRSPLMHGYGRPASSAQSLDRARAPGQTYDKALSGLRNALSPYEFPGWHCTRLTDAVADEILHGGMQLPNAATLARRIDALERRGLAAPDVAQRLKSENQDSEECRAGMVWFCFSSRER